LHEGDRLLRFGIEGRDRLHEVRLPEQGGTVTEDNQPRSVLALELRPPVKQPAEEQPENRKDRAEKQAKEQAEECTRLALEAMTALSKLRAATRNELDRMRCIVAEAAILPVGLYNAPEGSLSEADARKRLTKALALVHGAEVENGLKMRILEEIERRAKDEKPNPEQLLSTAHLIANGHRPEFPVYHVDGGWGANELSLAANALRLWPTKERGKWDTVNSLLGVFGLAVDTATPEERANWTPDRRAEWKHPLRKLWSDWKKESRGISVTPGTL
jgi:hypothetical protein